MCFFFKQKTAYEVRISDWSSDVCSSDLAANATALTIAPRALTVTADALSRIYGDTNPALTFAITEGMLVNGDALSGDLATNATAASNIGAYAITQGSRSEEHTSELQSLMRISYAVVCLKKKTSKKVAKLNTND